MTLALLSGVEQCLHQLIDQVQLLLSSQLLKISRDGFPKLFQMRVCTEALSMYACISSVRS